MTPLRVVVLLAACVIIIIALCAQEADSKSRRSIWRSRRGSRSRSRNRYTRRSRPKYRTHPGPRGRTPARTGSGHPPNKGSRSRTSGYRTHTGSRGRTPARTGSGRPPSQGSKFHTSGLQPSSILENVLPVGDLLESRLNSQGPDYTETGCFDGEFDCPGEQDDPDYDMCCGTSGSQYCCNEYSDD